MSYIINIINSYIPSYVKTEWSLGHKKFLNLKITIRWANRRVSFPINILK